MYFSGTSHGAVVFGNIENKPPSSYITIENCRISHNALSAILCRTSRYNISEDQSKAVASNFVIKNNEISNSAEGFLYESSSDKYAEDVLIENNYFHDMDQYDVWSKQDGHCIWVQHTENWTIRKNIFERICNAIALWKGSNSTIENVKIEDNDFIDVINHGGNKVDGTNQTFAIRIGGNNAPSKSGVQFGSGYNLISIINNRFKRVHYDCIESKKARSPQGN